jgi:outer membrane PBP1 activator LpoA protein
MIDGWLALAPLTRLTDDNAELLNALLSWSEEFPNHPAAGSVLAERLAAERGGALRADRIALLLPLGSAEWRTQALAVLEGFFAHHIDSGMAEQRTIRVYDTAQRGSAESFLTAQLEGTDFIVGPLLTDEVAQVQRQAGFVPTLALNLGTTELAAAPNFFQFALSSDDEVEAIAARAIADGHETAVALFLSSERGYRLATAFRDAFESLGGRVIGQSAYVRDQDQQTFQTPIEQLLNVTTSEGRRSRLQSDLGLAIEFEPRRRGDIDMIFLQAEPASGRLLVPLLRDNGAGEIPTYAMSEVFDPTRSGADTDLNGLIFPDLPLLVDQAGGGGAAVNRLGEYTPANADQWKRLFAFGYDAYGLVGALSSAPARWPLSGATGELYLGDNGRIRRALPFAEFRDGRPEALTPTQSPFSSNALSGP